MCVYNFAILTCESQFFVQIKIKNKKRTDFRFIYFFVAYIYLHR